MRSNYLIVEVIISKINIVFLNKQIFHIHITILKIKNHNINISKIKIKGLFK